jgi:hypothetical protein
MTKFFDEFEKMLIWLKSFGDWHFFNVICKLDLT